MECVLYLFCFNIVPCKRGWAWSEDAMALYGTYTMWVYFTPVIGGFLADRYLGYPGCCASALAMTLGHASMAVETPLFYILVGFLLWEWFV
jgi:POT family proton-dependent oligopeptide transporter